MHPLQLLLRSSKGPSNKGQKTKTSSIPSTGATKNPQLYGKAADSPSHAESPNRKRKRGSDQISSTIVQDAELNFFGGGASRNVEDEATGPVNNGASKDDAPTQANGAEDSTAPPVRMSDEERRSIFKRHKLKMTLLRLADKSDGQEAQGTQSKKDKKRKKMEKNAMSGQAVQQQIFPEPALDFGHLRSRFGIAPSMAQNIREQGYSEPTEVQMASLPVLLDSREIGTLVGGNIAESTTGMESLDLLTVAPTGSGKTLAFMIPLIHSLISLRRRKVAEIEGPKAIVLAPTKELAHQIANEGRKLAANTGVRITIVRKGMRLGQSPASEGDSHAEDRIPPVKSDILVSTPGTFGHAMEETEGKATELPSVRFLVLDEADVLLDPLFREQTLAVWNAITNPLLRSSLWSATMGSNIEELAKQIIDNRASNLASQSSIPVLRAALLRLVVGLKDSAVPNIDHRMTYAASEQGKLMALREILHPKSAPTAQTNPLRAPFLVFTQTIERAVALHSELLYDIPAEAGGISRISVLHSDLSDSARDSVMKRFRRGEIWVLITTDLLSRGVDFRGVNGVVNYDIPTSSAAYVHRVGRTGRAGREGGVAVTLYTKEDIPYVKNVANVIAAAQKQSGKADEVLPQWLLDSLPAVSKRAKKELKKRGVEARRSVKTKDKDKKGAARTRISTKSGFERRMENNRRGAIQATKRVREDSDGDEDAGSDFAGFE
ncbi:hypothetical protein MBLNU457_2017t1 [Dothideomycetes sp. NU457]